MPYEVFSIKWRPQIFEDVIGQEHISQTLKSAVQSNRLAPAYLFSGTRGVGKTSLARIFAKALNCRNCDDGNPCNKCPSCIDITKSSSVDVHEIDGASNRGIDEIRNIRENIKYLPSAGKYRIYIIDEVHMLTLHAFNALLKTLEEPPGHGKFIFATTEPHKVPITILSRCQRFDFKRIPLLKIENQIKKIAKKENITISDRGVSIISREAEGSLRDAESLLDQAVSFAGPTIDDDQIIDAFGIIERDLIYKMSQAIIDSDSNKCLEIVNDIYNHGYEIKEFYGEIMNQFRNLVISLIPQNTSHILDLPDNELIEAKKQSKMAGKEMLIQSLNFLINREADIRYTSNPRIALEAILLKLIELRDYLSFNDLIKKIENIEKRLNKSVSKYSDKAPNSVYTRESAESTEEVNIEYGKKWPGFIKYMMTKNRAMANLLKKLTHYEFAGNRLEITLGGGSFTESYFDDPDHYEQLITYVRDFFKSNFSVILKKQNGIQDSEKTTDKKDTSTDLVKDVVDIFEGKIVR